MTSDPKYPLDVDTLTIGVKQAREIARPYAQAYQSATPYNHICIDNFLPADILTRTRQDIESLPSPEEAFDNAREKLKTSYNPDKLPEYTKNLFHALNSRGFLAFLEQLTGIRGLIPDPYFHGAGIHRVSNGGHLDIHADFNLHSVMKVERRLNVLIYLNPDWQEGWGGSFEIWDKEMTHKESSFVPLFNRMVCFSTASDTFHGNPETVNNPNGDPRLSIALYYYTATWDDSRKSHSTLFKPRPGSADQVDRANIAKKILKDWLPPTVQRWIKAKKAES